MGRKRQDTNSQQDAGNEQAPPIQDEVVEQTASSTPVPQVDHNPVSTVQERQLKPGECLVLKNGRDEVHAFVTNIANWNSIYNSGKNAGKYTLLAEKKSKQ